MFYKGLEGFLQMFCICIKERIRRSCVETKIGYVQKRREGVKIIKK